MSTDVDLGFREDDDGDSGSEIRHSRYPASGSTTVVEPYVLLAIQYMIIIVLQGAAAGEVVSI